MKQILGPRVLVKIITEKNDQSRGGIYLPSNVQDEAFPTETGTVIQVGTGYYQAGINIPMEVKAGDTILFAKMAPRLEYFDENGKKFHVLADSEIVAIL